jgi:hypothetical protein
MRKIDKEEWLISARAQRVLGKREEIEVASLALGAQIEAEWLPFLGIDYDPRNDIIEIALDGLDHLVRNSPRAVLRRGPERHDEPAGDRRRWRQADHPVAPPP